MSERKIVEYKVLAGTSRKELAKEVTDSMSAGRQPYGGITVRHIAYGFGYQVLQAMVKYESVPCED